MLLIVAVILLLLLFGLGFTVHALWLLLAFLLVVALIAAASGRTLW